MEREALEALLEAARLAFTTPGDGSPATRAKIAAALDRAELALATPAPVALADRQDW